jgi:hypothetical protein
MGHLDVDDISHCDFLLLDVFVHRGV